MTFAHRNLRQVSAADVERWGYTHEVLAERLGLPRSAVTGILSGSVQRVSINRVLRLVEAAGLVAEVFSATIIAIKQGIKTFLVAQALLNN